MSSFCREENVDEVNEKIYIAVSKEWKACKSILEWVIRVAKGKKLCLVHVHQPAQYFSMLGGRFPISSMAEKEVIIHQEKERQNMCKILDEYIRICSKAQVEVEKLHIEMDTVERGLLELISQHKIERLVMGAAADKYYSRKMTEPKSKKANYVCQHAPPFCNIWFICKGQLIYTREGTKQSHLNDEDLSRQEHALARLTRFTSHLSASTSIADSEGSCDDGNRSTIYSPSRFSIVSVSSEAASESTLYHSEAEDGEEPSSRSLVLLPKPDEMQLYFPSSNVLEGKMDTLYYELDQAIAEAEIAKQEAFEESLMRQRKAERDATEANRKAQAIETLYYDELRRREELEEELAEVKEKLERTKEERDMALDKLRVAVDQNLLLESRAEESDVVRIELEEKIVSALELVQNFRKL